MAKFPGLVRRKGVFYYRRRVPLDVREAFGRDEVMVSLRTSDRKRASDAWLEERARWEDEFDRLREQASAIPHTPEPQVAGPETFTSTSRLERLRQMRRPRQTAGLRPLDNEIALKLAMTWFVDAYGHVLLKPPPKNLELAIDDAAADISALARRHTAEADGRS